MRSILQLIFRNFFAHPDNIRLKAQALIVKEYLKGIGTPPEGGSSAEAFEVEGSSQKGLSSAKKEVEKAIDIGCGTGRYTKFLSEVAKFVVGVDPNSEMLRRVREKYRRQDNVGAGLVSALSFGQPQGLPLLARGEVGRLPFKEGVFDVALLLEVLEHVEDDRGGLCEVRRILKHNGELILSIPCPPPVYLDKLHKRDGYTKEGIIGLLEETGFKVISYEFCMLRWSRMMLKFAVNFMSIFKIPPPLLPLLKFERFFKKPPPFDIIVKAKK